VRRETTISEAAKAKQLSEIKSSLMREDLGGCYPVREIYVSISICPSDIFPMTNREELGQPLEKLQKIC